MKEQIEIDELFERVKEISNDLNSNYISTEHYLAALLEYEEISNIFEISKKQYIDKILEIVGKPEMIKETKLKTLKKMALMTPKLEEIYENLAMGEKDILDTIIFMYEEDCTAIRILKNMMSINKIHNIIKKIKCMQININSLKNEMPKYLTNLNEKKYITNPAIGRSEIIDKIQKNLLKLNKPNILLLGEPGVGKTAIVEGLAYKIKNGEAHDRLKDSIILSVSSSTLVAGTKYRGEFEEKINQLCDFLKKYPNCILFIDEMHTTINAGGAEGAIDMANILKPYLSRGDIKVIGATTLKESKVITDDGAYNRRFTKILIDEPNPLLVNVMLEKSITKFENFYKIKINKNLINSITKYSQILDGKLPDKAIDLLENICIDTIFNNKKVIQKEDIKKIAEEMQKNQNILKERL